MFQEPQPYHSKQLNLGKRFGIYLQAFRVIDKANFLQEAKVLHLAMDKKNEAGWNSVLPMFTAFLAGGRAPTMSGAPSKAASGDIGGH
jgi:hypothetical protein